MASTQPTDLPVYGPKQIPIAEPTTPKGNGSNSKDIDKRGATRSGKKRKSQEGKSQRESSGATTGEEKTRSATSSSSSLVVGGYQGEGGLTVNTTDEDQLSGGSGFVPIFNGPVELAFSGSQDGFSFNKLLLVDEAFDTVSRSQLTDNPPEVTARNLVTSFCICLSLYGELVNFPAFVFLMNVFYVMTLSPLRHLADLEKTPQRSLRNLLRGIFVSQDEERKFTLSGFKTPSQSEIQEISSFLFGSAVAWFGTSTFTTDSMGEGSKTKFMSDVVSALTKRHQFLASTEGKKLLQEHSSFFMSWFCPKRLFCFLNFKVPGMETFEAFLPTLRALIPIPSSLELRVGGLPAGLSKLAFAFQAVKFIGNSDTRFLIELREPTKHIVREIHKVLKNPLCFHSNANRIRDVVPMRPAIPEEPTLSLLKSICHGVNESLPFLRAFSIRNIPLIQETVRLVRAVMRRKLENLLDHLDTESKLILSSSINVPSMDMIMAAESADAIPFVEEMPPSTTTVKSTQESSESQEKGARGAARDAKRRARDYRGSELPSLEDTVS